MSLQDRMNDSEPQRVAPTAGMVLSGLGVRGSSPEEQAAAIAEAIEHDELTHEELEALQAAGLVRAPGTAKPDRAHS